MLFITLKCPQPLQLHNIQVRKERDTVHRQIMKIMPHTNEVFIFSLHRCRTILLAMFSCIFVMCIIDNYTLLLVIYTKADKSDVHYFVKVTSIFGMTLWILLEFPDSLCNCVLFVLYNVSM